jgi:two-component system CheB/CheR fusion protein
MVRDMVGKLICLSRSKYGVKLDRYRRSCISRKVTHRMFRLGCERMEDYIDYFLDHPGEVARLLKAVTIQVTGFFRDMDVFEVLAETVVPELVRAKLSSCCEGIRIWSAGCATGEEAYSVAILFLDYPEVRINKMKVKVMGTDISEESLDVARRGRYEREKLKDVSVRMKNLYFKKDGKTYLVAQRVKNTIRFSAHDLFTESPLSQLDLIICRNVLIHFKQFSRLEIMERFYRSLNEGGILLLGKSEAVGGEALELFDLINPRAKIYRKIPASRYKED